MDDLGVKGTRRARVRTRCEFRKRRTKQVGGRDDLQGGRRRKEVTQKLKEKRVPGGVDLLWQKDPSKTMKEKREGGGRKGFGGERRWTKGVGSHSEAISGHVTRINLATRIFFWLVRENQTFDKASNDSLMFCSFLSFRRWALISIQKNLYVNYCRLILMTKKKFTIKILEYISCYKFS